MTQRQGRHFEYKSEFALFGIPIVHVVIGRDPHRVGLNKAMGIAAVGRVAIGVVAVGQIAMGVLSIGQLALGLLLALGQVAPAGWESFGQVSIASRLAVGQVAVARHAMGQVVVAQYGIGQVGAGMYILQPDHPSPEALRQFRREFPTLYRWLAPLIGEKTPAESEGG